MAEFPCPACRANRGGLEADCPRCSWTRSPPPEAKECPYCDGQDFAWGWAEARAWAEPLSPYPLRFRREGKSGDQLIRARKCNGCGNVQFFVTDE